jgi:hypothetical protein
MEIATVNHADTRVLECLSPIRAAGDAVDLVSACIERDTRRLLLEAPIFPEAFFDLRTKFAGEFVQKLQNYQVRTAAVFPATDGYSERFQEFAVEAKRGAMFRVFAARMDALNWLTAA